MRRRRREEATEDGGRRRRSPRGVVALVALGVAVTGLMLWVARSRYNDASEVEGASGDAAVDVAPVEKVVREVHVGRAVRATVVFLMVVAAVLGMLRGFTTLSPYVDLSSGPLVGVGTNSSIALTTVNEQRLSWAEYWVIKMVGQGKNLVPYSEVAGPGEAAANVSAMREAKTDAGAVAVYAVTGKMPLTYVAATVSATLTKLPAAKAGVKGGDEIVSVDGVKPKSIEALARMIRASKGAEITLGIRRGLEHLRIHVRAVTYQKTWKIGVDLVAVTKTDVKALPKAPATGTVQGPSGGLMMALGDISEISPGQLAPWPIAGTGTIDATGGIGGIGDVTYKVQGAVAAGAKVFFVPQANANEAWRAAKGRIRVVVVNSVGDALAWLCAHGSQSHVCGSPGLYTRLGLLLRPAH